MSEVEEQIKEMNEVVKKGTKKRCKLGLTLVDIIFFSLIEGEWFCDVCIKKERWKTK